MTDSRHELSIIQSLAERFERSRLPRLLDLRQRVEQGDVLSELDIVFLEEVIHDARQSKPLMDHYPEWQRFCASVIHLYEQITEKALDNENSIHRDSSSRFPH